jgi:hypothetical protein
VISFDLPYAHMFVEDGKIDRTDTLFGGTAAATTVGTRGNSQNTWTSTG